jgi:hypothetical protein
LPAPTEDGRGRPDPLTYPNYLAALRRAKAATLKALRMKPTEDWRLLARGSGECEIPKATIDKVLLRSDELWGWCFLTPDPVFWAVGLIRTVAAGRRARLGKAEAAELEAAGQRVFECLAPLDAPD